jgi:hypothetical protein
MSLRPLEIGGKNHFVAALLSAYSSGIFHYSPAYFSPVPFRIDASSIDKQRMVG